MRKSPIALALLGLPLLLSSLLPAHSAAAAPVQVILDGRPLALDPAPTIVNDRTLVPLRGVFEAMGAELTWNPDTRSVEVERGDRYIKLKIDRQLACLNRECTAAATMDVPARIFTDRTFVPVRFITQAMGFNVTWDNDQRAVIINTQKAPDYQFTQVTIPSLSQGQLIQGPISLQAKGAAGSKVQFYLLDPATGAGPMIAAGSDPTAAYTFTPDPTVKGARLVVAAITDQAGVVRYSDPVTVTMAPQPQVQVTGLDWGGLIDGPITFGNEVNFVATHVKLRLMDTKGNMEDLVTHGPGDKLTWYPQIAHNGEKSIIAVAYDRHGNTYESAPVAVRVQSDYRTSFSGLKDGSVLTRPLNLGVGANYPVESVKYVLDGQVLGWGFNYWWKFGPEKNGAHTLEVEVTDKQGTVRKLGPYQFTINTTPQVWMSGVGPDQVVTPTDKLELKVSSNMNLNRVEYYLVDDITGGTTHIGNTGPWDALAWSPTTAQAGRKSIQAVAYDTNGQMIRSDKVSFRVFTGKVYGPTPLVPKNEFKDLAIKLSVPAYKETGMAASLQVAQSILETGWGQFVPVDKYKGQVSYNLFGIKGTGPAGSIISNTWEVYNGVTYRIDANFRAYNNAAESWKDHKALLLEKPWYAPFRAVMTDPVLGAWALKRSGYATDPNYPIKLIDIMKANGLFELDKIEL